MFDLFLNLCLYTYINLDMSCRGFNYTFWTMRRVCAGNSAGCPSIPEALYHKPNMVFSYTYIHIYIYRYIYKCTHTYAYIYVQRIYSCGCKMTRVRAKPRPFYEQTMRRTYAPLLGVCKLCAALCAPLWKVVLSRRRKQLFFKSAILPC